MSEEKIDDSDGEIAPILDASSLIIVIFPAYVGCVAMVSRISRVMVNEVLVSNLI